MELSPRRRVRVAVEKRLFLHLRLRSPGHLEFGHPGGGAASYRGEGDGVAEEVFGAGLLVRPAVVKEPEARELRGVCVDVARALDDVPVNICRQSWRAMS